MAKTKIEWTDESSNPIRARLKGSDVEWEGWFCTKCSEGCANCYSETMNARFGNKLAYTRPNEEKVEFVLVERELERVKGLSGRKVFICDMTDLFHPLVPEEMIQLVWEAMEAAQQHTFQVLTKRPGRMLEFVKGRRFLPNVWLGVSVENQARADKRIPMLLETPAAVRFVSCEPLLGPVDLGRPFGQGIGELLIDYLDQVIVGGESGPGARAAEIVWFHDLVQQCRDAGVACFVKQMGSVWARENDSKGKGGEPEKWPEELRVREFPNLVVPRF